MFTDHDCRVVSGTTIEDRWNQIAPAEQPPWAEADYLAWKHEQELKEMRERTERLHAPFLRTPDDVAEDSRASGRLYGPENSYAFAFGNLTEKYVALWNAYHRLADAFLSNPW